MFDIVESSNMSGENYIVLSQPVSLFSSLCLAEIPIVGNVGPIKLPVYECPADDIKSKLSFVIKRSYFSYTLAIMQILSLTFRSSLRLILRFVNL